MFDVAKRVYNKFVGLSVRDSRSDYSIFQLFLVLLFATTILFYLAIISAGASSFSGLIFSVILTGINLVAGFFIVYVIATIPSRRGAAKNEFEIGNVIRAVSLQQQFAVITTGPDAS